MSKIAISQQLAKLRGPRRAVTPDAWRISPMPAEGKSFPPGSAFPGCSFREMPLVAHTENISLFFCGLSLVTWSSLAMDVQFRGVPPRFASFTDRIFPLPPNRRRQREADEEEGPLSV